MRILGEIKDEELRLLILQIFGKNDTEIEDNFKYYDGWSRKRVEGSECTKAV